MTFQEFWHLLFLMQTTPSNTLEGFKVAEISLFDTDIFQEADFAAALTKNRPMALSVSPTNQFVTNPEVSIRISSGSYSCVRTPQRIVSEHSAQAAIPGLVHELPCLRLLVSALPTMLPMIYP